MSSESDSVSVVRLWRTNFLSLRDEALTPTDPSHLAIIRDLILSHRHSLVDAASHLSPYEVSTDLIYLLSLAASSTASACEGNNDEESAYVFCSVCYLINDVACSVALRLRPPAWSQLLDSFSKLVGFFLNSRRIIYVSETGGTGEAVLSCLDTTRCFISSNDCRLSPSDNVQLLNFLLHVVNCCHAQLHISLSHQINGATSEERTHSIPQSSCLLKIQGVAFSMIGEAFSRDVSLLPVEIWHLTLEILRKVMDPLAKKTILLEDPVMPRYYVSLLDCLHTVLTNRKASLSDQVASIVAMLQMFLTYGVSNRYHVSSQKYYASSVSSNRLRVAESEKANSERYRPPHLRKKLLQSKPKTFKTFQDQALSPVDSLSSDSEYSDSERQSDDSEYVWGCKARIAAITCIQDLCSADPKAFVAQWTMLLPTNDVLHPRKREMTLMTCLLYDPYMKARLAAASAIAAMLDGTSSVILQVAEYKDSFRCGSYMSLSSSLGQILMQLHAGILHLIQHETRSGLLMSSFKILNHLIALTPYSRMPKELIPSVLSSLQTRILEGYPHKSDQSTLLALSISCLTAAVSTSPSSADVTKLLQDEISSGLNVRRPGDGILSTLFQLASRAQNPKISFEALQALRAVYHFYPHVMLPTREQVSGVVKGFLESDPDKGAVGGSQGSCPDKVVAAAVKVLDEFLRARTGFRGTEDAFDDKLVQTPFYSDCVRSKKISSAPSNVPWSLNNTSEFSKSCPPGLIEWQEALEELLPFTLCHASGLVRSASITCFAGLTSPVFYSLKQETKNFLLSSCIDAATKDGVPSVRSAACRAIGVLTCFPDICRSAEILQTFVHATEINTHHHLISVRIPATWAIANICDSFHHCFASIQDVRLKFQIVASLSECALRLAKDGDKIKSNAVRALGSLSRCIPFKSKSEDFSSTDRLYIAPNWCMNLNLLDQIVQAFLSCITTGNVKVQWNVCYALSKLFLNENLDLQYMDWAPSVYSVLLVLLRDSSNFKIRIQAAAALAAPARALDYGRSFSDVVQGVEHVVVSLESSQTTLPPNFQYRIALEKQVTATFLHIISLCSTCGDERVKEFLLKKIPFFEGWFQVLCASLKEEGKDKDKDGMEVSFNIQRKTGLILQAAKSLIEVYEGKSQIAPAERLKKVLNDCPLVSRGGKSQDSPSLSLPEQIEPGPNLKH